MNIMEIPKQFDLSDETAARFPVGNVGAQTLD